jgi:hypothetical protein
MTPETLEKVKLFLRRRHDKLDDDLRDNIESCLADLKVHGIVHKDDTDPLILNAIKLWCKSADTDDVARSSELRQRYLALRDSLKSAKGYGWRDDSDE